MIEKLLKVEIPPGRVDEAYLNFQHQGSHFKIQILEGSIAVSDLRDFNRQNILMDYAEFKQFIIDEASKGYSGDESISESESGRLRSGKQFWRYAVLAIVVTVIFQGTRFFLSGSHDVVEENGITFIASGEQLENLNRAIHGVFATGLQPEDELVVVGSEGQLNFYAIVGTDLADPQSFYKFESSAFQVGLVDSRIVLVTANGDLLFTTAQGQSLVWDDWKYNRLEPSNIPEGIGFDMDAVEPSESNSP